MISTDFSGSGERVVFDVQLARIDLREIDLDTGAHREYSSPCVLIT